MSNRITETREGLVFYTRISDCPDCQVKKFLSIGIIYGIEGFSGMCSFHAKEALARFTFPWLCYVHPYSRRLVNRICGSGKLVARVYLLKSIVRKLRMVVTLQESDDNGFPSDILTELRSCFKAFVLHFPRFQGNFDETCNPPERTFDFFGPGFFSFDSMFNLPRWWNVIKHGLKRNRDQINDMASGKKTYFSDERNNQTYAQYIKGPHTLVAITFMSLFRLLRNEMVVLQMMMSKRNARAFELHF